MEPVICLLVGYVCGNVLFAEVVARVAAHRSIYDVGNGNPGMANTARSLGAGAAVACLVGDIGKVAVAALVCRHLFPQMGAVAAGWAGIGATLGHDFPLWHGLRGGKGVATLSATLFLTDWRCALVAAVVAGVTIVVTGYLSIAAVAAAAAFVVAVALLGGDGGLLAVALAALVLATLGQWTNLWGIRDGTASHDFSRRH